MAAKRSKKQPEYPDEIKAPQPWDESGVSRDIGEAPSPEEAVAEAFPWDEVQPPPMDAATHAPSATTEEAIPLQSASSPFEVDWEMVEAEEATTSPTNVIPDTDGLPTESDPFPEGIPATATPQPPLERWMPPANPFEPAERIQPKPIPAYPVDSRQEAIIARQITNEMRMALLQEIQHLYDEVEQKLSVNRDLSTEALKKLNEAQTIVLAEPGRYPEAELRVKEVRILLRRAEESERAAAKHAKPLFAFNIGVLVFFFALAIFDHAIAKWLAAHGVDPLYPQPLTDSQGNPIPMSMAMYFLPWNTMVWGGIGGAIGALYTLRNYVAHREFDPLYNIHYWAHPLMGAALGAIVYYLFVGGFFVVESIVQTAQLLDPAQRVITATSPVLSLIALAFGLWQSAVYKTLMRVVDSVTGGSKDEEEERVAAETEALKNALNTMQPTPFHEVQPPDTP
ncbi:MAG: hypothetical protein D6802_12315 [Ardenticatenia bacterium]|nr:MAG: hypothetical protein D6802_12315 [Ardenticatenia bacterium]